MKRVCESMHLNEEVPSDVWSYIINIYHHLRFTEQWQKLKLACLSHNKYLLPTDKVEILLYEGYTTMIKECSLLYNLHYLCWGADGVITGACMDSYDFMSNHPSLRLACLGHSQSIVVFNSDAVERFSKHDFAQSKGKLLTTVSRLMHTKPLVGYLTIPLSTFPSHLFT